MRRQSHVQKVNLPNGYRADLHVHTSASIDCRTSVRELLAAAKAAGLHAIAITDHDSMDSIPEAVRLAAKFGLQIIPGAEITAKEGAHILGYFIQTLPKPGSTKQIVEDIKRQGGVSCIAHPYRRDSSGICNNLDNNTISVTGFQQTMRSANLVEVVNFKSVICQNEDGGKLAKKYGKLALASTDAHYAVEVGKAFTCFNMSVDTQLTPDLLCNSERTLWSHPINYVPQKKLSLPLQNFEPSINTVSRLKKFLGPIIPLIGRVLFAWQKYGWKKAREKQIAAIVRKSPLPQPYTF